MKVEMMILGITMFGALRFGMNALARFGKLDEAEKKFGWIPLGCMLGAMAWCAVHPYSFENVFEMAAGFLTVVSAVVSADFLVGRAVRARAVNWIGSFALASGFATPFVLSLWFAGEGPETWWHPWLLPAYGISFLVCGAGRAVVRLAPK